MLQTRAGRCPNCKEETLPGATICPACGAQLGWENEARRSTSSAGSTPARSATPSHSKSATVPFLRLFALFLIACFATMAAVTYRSKSSKQSDSPSLQAAHAILVQDAEIFRDGIKVSVGSNDAPEAAFVIGVALPRGREVLEVTVKNEWKTLDYPTRLGLAAKLAERWKTVHAPHRSYLSILDESGNEIGGRTWNGTVWVQETHEDAPKPRPTTPPAPEATSTPPADEATDGTSGDTANATANNTNGSASDSADGGTPEPETTSTPAPAALDELSDIENQ